MADSEKNLEATRRKLDDARKRGEVPRSSDVTSAVVFLGVLVGLWLLGRYFVRLFQALWLSAMGSIDRHLADQQMLVLGEAGARFLLMGVLPIAAIALVCGIVGAFVQVGPLVAFEQIKPQLARLNPAEGLKRMFAVRNLVNLLKTVIKIALLGGLIYVLALRAIEDGVRTGYARPADILLLIAHILLMMCCWAAVIYLIMAVIDYVHERYEFMKRQRMSVEEYRREYKDTQGDPMIAGRRRAAFFEAAFFGVGERVRVSTAVVYSTQYAVALRYDGPGTLPKVVAKGGGQVAARIRQAAADYLIPSAFDSDLAQRLYLTVPLDRFIDRSLFERVADLMRWAKGG
ncbi:EscU/YscU/HrcU family type III secretion system export apparatus switch protein [Cupriavidus gilardii]|uniref:EscU/YscU/HrcU family type III secretion system export apparatus switch protein n=1 Tax=Cupriavidus gilardii TaxID=82541 RepID=UPI001EE5B6C8|nr:EscU/YscU/HrcU family type III secretion system export apparatus switch protein [Cupriavidus gilardii]MCG5260459.1 EscU/YscU/HrcU family type III secretion system export apparatus switch protein [Cupriavidus gilardii]MDF9428308.1 EscU/YscU/HrcU family type III secretion system export apparatus switch protein [Cupriavidus gilardii]